MIADHFFSFFLFQLLNLHLCTIGSSFAENFRSGNNIIPGPTLISVLAKQFPFDLFMPFFDIRLFPFHALTMRQVYRTRNLS